MAYDIPSISDLEAIQLLNKHYAEVVTSKKDGIASGSDITQTTNPITGVTRRTLYKILDDMDDTFLERLLKMAFTPVGTFTAGATLTDARQTLLWEVSQGGDGHYYSWSGTFPKAVTAGSSPSPIEAGSWVDRTDDSLRDEIRETVFQNMKHQAAEAGFNLVDGSFEEGANISGWPDVVWSQADGKYYQWYLDESKTVAAGATPATSGGIGAGAWVDRTDVTLRSDLLDGALQVRNSLLSLRDFVSVKDFGAVGDGVADDTAAIQAALDSGAYTVWLPKGIYKITNELSVTNASLLGEGVVYASPYSTSSLSGTIIAPTGMQNKSAISINTVTNNNGISVGGFGIDMTMMTAGTLSGDFDISGMTKGIFIENRHNTSLHDIEVFAVPSNSAAFVMHSLYSGGGMYFGKHDRLAVRTKLATGNDPSAKGFVIFGTNDSITAQVFTDCTSYRGWYLKKANNCQFIGCHAENNPKDGWYIDGGNALTFIGGFQEGQGNEESSRTYYQFYGVNNPTRVTLIGGGLSGNGTYGLTAGNGFVRINFGGASADQLVNRFANLHLDSAGNINLLGNSAALLYGVNFNSTVPADTTQFMPFKYSKAGFDKLAEYNENSGNYTFRLPSSSFGDGNGIYAIDVDLEFKNAKATALTPGYYGYFSISGGGWSGYDKVYGYTNGTKYLIVRGRLLIKVTDKSQNGAYFTCNFYHNYTESLVMTNSNGSASVSRVMVTKVQ